MRVSIKNLLLNIAMVTNIYNVSMANDSELGQNADQDQTQEIGTNENEQATPEIQDSGDTDSLAESEGSLEVITDKTESFISAGNRIFLSDKGFSIVPPKGWEVSTNFPNVSLLFQMPLDKVTKYRRTVQVMKFSEGIPIDELTGKEYEAMISQKFSKTVGGDGSYRMRNHMMTELENGTPAILYYSEFKLNHADLMQAHILTSGADYRYLITFTDLASHFEGDEASEYLTEAWNSMVSMRFDSKPPLRLRGPVTLWLSIGFVALFLLLLIATRKVKAGKKYGDLIDAVDHMKSSVSTGVSELTGGAGISNAKSIKATAKSAILIDDEEFTDDIDDDLSQWNITQEEPEVDAEISEFEEDELDDKAS